jgi:4'-phosphopantetheinyl transferase
MAVKTLDSLSPLFSLSVQKLWNNNDILLFLVDLEIYEQLGLSYLSSDEKEYLTKLKTNYFRKRFIVSRSLLKIILQHVLKKRSSLDISLYRNNSGRVCVHNNEEIYICISYTENLVAFSISKQKTGIDIEYIRPIDLKIFSKCLQNTISKNEMFQENDVDKLKIWTLREAYCKLTDQSMLECLNKQIVLNDIDHKEYIINNRYILSVAFASKENNIKVCHIQKGTHIKMAKPLLRSI